MGQGADGFAYYLPFHACGRNRTHRMNLEIMGWVATVLSVASYFFREPAVLRRVQAGASCIWIIYGLIIGSAPLVACNVIVATAAVYSSVRIAREASRSDHMVSFAV